MAVINDPHAREVFRRLLRKESRSLKAKALWWDANGSPDTDAEMRGLEQQVAAWRVDAAHLDTLVKELEQNAAVCLHL